MLNLVAFFNSFFYFYCTVSEKICCYCFIYSICFQCIFSNARYFLLVKFDVHFLVSVWLVVLQ